VRVLYSGRNLKQCGDSLEVQRPEPEALGLRECEGSLEVQRPDHEALGLRECKGSLEVHGRNLTLCGPQGAKVLREHTQTYGMPQLLCTQPSLSITHPRTYISTAGGDDKIYRLFCTTAHSDDGAVRPETCSSLCVLKHYCNYMAVSAFRWLNNETI
jgi:hypothetical protein